MPPSGKSASSRSGGARMREVADRAGVSRMTVSRALNQPEKVKETLRQRVLESVEALGYVHNHLARSLSSRRSNVVGLVLPSLENSIFAQTLKGISDILRPQGYHLMVAESSDDTEEEERVIAAFLAQRVGGLILHSTIHTPGAIRLLKAGDIPVVENGDLPSNPVDMVISYSNRNAAKAMTLHLWRLGYRKIAFAGLTQQLACDGAPARLRGSAHRGRQCARSEPDGRGVAGVRRRCGGDRLYRAEFPRRRRRILRRRCSCGGCPARVHPARLAGSAEAGRVASFDDLDLLRHLTPTVTSLRLARYEIGRRSAEMLLARLQDREMPVSTVDLGFEIVQRAST